MTDIEASSLIKEWIAKIQNGEEELTKSEEFIAIASRYDELEKSSENEPSEKIEEEKKQLEDKANDLLTKIFGDLLTIDQGQITEVLSKITPEFLEENHIPISTGFFGVGPFEKLINHLLTKLDDPTHELHNNLLANERFISAISYDDMLVSKLIEDTNNEQVLLNFLHNSSQLLEGSNDIIHKIVISENYSDAFKKEILSNEEFIHYISDDSLLYIIRDDKFPKEKKIELIFRPDIFEKLSDSKFSEALAQVCENYDEYSKFLNDERVLEKINIYMLFSHVNLSSEEAKKLILDDRIYSRIAGGELGFLLNRGNFDFESKKNLLFDEKIFAKFNDYALENFMNCKNLTASQRMEILNDDRIYSLIRANVCVVDRIVKSSYIPILERISIARNEKFINYISNYAFSELMSNSDLPLETATEILFDKNIFYRLIGEWNDEYYHPNHFYGNKGPYRYDKYEYVKKLYEKNPSIARTLNYKLLKDDILDFGFDFIEKVSKYYDVSSKLAYAFSSGIDNVYIKNMIKTINNSKYASNMDVEMFTTKIIDIANDSSAYGSDPKKMRKLAIIRKESHLNISEFTEENWKTITEIGFRDMSLYYNGIANGWLFGNTKKEVDITLNILPDVKTNDDLNNYTAKRFDLCDEYFRKAIEEKKLDLAKNAYFNKYFSINIQEAKEIVRMFGSDIQEFSDNSEYLMQTKYIQQLQKILDIQKLSTISDIYNNSETEPLTFDESIFIDQSIRQMYSKQISDSVYKITDKVMNENGEYVQNVPKVMEFVVEKNGEKTIEKVQVYEPGFDFKMLVNSTAAYGKLELINDNYFDSWNKSERTSNHGICCSLIANDNLGMAAVNDVLIAFDSWDAKAISKMAPYDIYSANDGYDIQEGRKLKFMSAQGIKNNTRHSHNELVLERFELRDNKRMKKYKNIQPSYVVIYSDMTNEIKQKALKCSNEMKIPIVYLDKEKIVKNEVNKIDNKIKKIKECNTIDEKLPIIEQILLSHENNRSGLRLTNNDWLEKYFPTSKIEKIFESIIIEMQTRYKETGNIEDYFNQSTKLIDILEKEKEKFDVAMEATERKNFIDIPVEDYKKTIMQFVDNDLCRTNYPKLEDIIEFGQIESPDTELSQTLSTIDQSFIHEQIQDIVFKNLYPNEGRNHNIGHIERVIFLSQMIGRQELKLENGEIDKHAMKLLTECAKYHDCGRENDVFDKKHGRKSADKMLEFLQQDGYDEEDIKIMQIAVEYHEEVDDDFRFNKICEKYELNVEKADYAKKISNCLKDADALDRTRFRNQIAMLDEEKLRFESSKDLISIAESLNKSYKVIDKKQYAKSCRYLLQKSENREVSTENEMDLQSESGFHK